MWAKYFPAVPSDFLALSLWGMCLLFSFFSFLVFSLPSVLWQDGELAAGFLCKTCL